MGLIVLPVTIPDLTSVYDAYFAAFRGDVILDVLYPDGITDEFRKLHTPATLQWWHTVTMQHTLKCVDTETGEIVGMAVWEVFWRERTDEERKKPAIEWLQGKQRERADGFFERLWEKREKYLGSRRHVYCMFVAVHPAHQRRGVGKLLMEWGLGVGEKLQLPVYLESSSAGLPLYTKLGFERLSESAVLSPALTHKDSDVEIPLMVKMPAAAGGMTFEEWAAKGHPRFSS
ncbi:hypothetical protein FQN53_002804 [Emmonsiellopsis sp. PD_33]|nr:hypothetical protein FQN53_002804 [Emmonsiellopsis sp. PD_33]